MADFYEEMRGVSIDLLSPTAEGGLGQGEIKLVRYTASPPPTDPWLPPIPPTRTFTILKAAAFGVSKELVGLPLDNGGNVVATDLYVIAAPWDGQYEPADVIEIDGRAVTVLRVENIPAAGTVSVIRFIVRQ